MPTTKGNTSMVTIILTVNTLFIDNCWPDSLLIKGSNNNVITNARINASHVIKTDSLKNCIIISLRCAPTTFLTPISLARNMERAVERFM